MPVSISVVPLTSRSSSTAISVSLVLRLALAVRPIKFLLLKPCLHSAGMIVQPFHPRQMDNFRRQGMQRLSTGMNHARALEKIVCPKGREKTRASPRWENVIWACQVISQGGRRVRADKDGPRIANRRQPLVGPSHQQLHVLRRYLIGNLNAFTEPPGNDNRPVSLQGLDGNRAPPGPLDLLSQRRLDPARQRKHTSELQSQSNLIVFSLREHIRGHVRRIRMGISQEENLARPRNGIDIHLPENH